MVYGVEIIEFVPQSIDLRTVNHSLTPNKS